MCYGTGKCTVCRCVCTSLGLEILHAGVVKGLIMEGGGGGGRGGDSSAHHSFWQKDEPVWN